MAGRGTDRRTDGQRRMEEQRANEQRDGGTDGEREGPDGVSLTPWQRTVIHVLC